MATWFVARGWSAEHWELEPMKSRFSTEARQVEPGFFIGNGQYYTARSIMLMCFKCGEVVATGLRIVDLDLDFPSSTRHLGCQFSRF